MSFTEAEEVHRSFCGGAVVAPVLHRLVPPQNLLEESVASNMDKTNQTFPCNEFMTFTDSEKVEQSVQ